MKKTTNTSRTKATLKAALERAREFRVRHFVVASTSGSTALELAKVLPPHSEAVCVTHHAGFHEFGKLYGMTCPKEVSFACRGAQWDEKVAEALERMEARAWSRV